MNWAIRCAALTIRRYSSTSSSNVGRKRGGPQKEVKKGNAGHASHLETSKTTAAPLLPELTKSGDVKRLVDRSIKTRLNVAISSLLSPKCASVARRRSFFSDGRAAHQWPYGGGQGSPGEATRLITIADAQQVLFTLQFLQRPANLSKTIAVLTTAAPCKVLKRAPHPLPPLTSLCKGVIDLHGYRVKEALTVTEHKVALWINSGMKKPLVTVVGKGNGSGEKGPVMGTAVLTMLKKRFDSSHFSVAYSAKNAGRLMLKRQGPPM